MHRQVRFAGDPGDSAGFDPAAPARELNFARLVAQGRQVFVKEKFDGNGRACGTCHVESNNFTIDPAFIATLPRTDPLFVAENNPSLAADFEKPDLMRRFGFFVENADGFDDLHGEVHDAVGPDRARPAQLHRPAGSVLRNRLHQQRPERGSTRTAGLEQ